MDRERSLRRPPVAALALFAISFVAVLAAGLTLTRGELVLPLDDAYIHFSLARTLADDHTYGLQPGVFSTPASSLVWPFALAAARALSLALDRTALVLGALAGASTVLSLDRVLERAGLGDRARFVWLAVVIALVPLAPIAALGMEHAAHIATVVALVAEATRAPAPRSRRLAFLSALVVGLRYEGVFVVALVALLLTRRRELRGAAIALASGAVLPLAAAAFFIHHGAPFAPASVLMKRTEVPLGALPTTILDRLRANPHVAALLVGAALLFRAVPRDAPARGWLAVGFGALALQTAFAQIGWLYRYEAYAVAVTLAGVAMSWATLRRAWRPVAIALALACAPRGALAHATVPRAARNIADQQMQIAHFLASRREPRSPVAVNDVGATTFFGQSRIVDLIGLGDLRVAAARGFRIDHGLSRDDLVRITRESGVRHAVLYEPWFKGTVPDEWTAVERWRIRDNRVCAFDTVTFYGTSPDAAAELERALDAYRAKLPAGVEALPIFPRK